MMNSAYIREFMSVLKHTKIYVGTNIELDYEAGIDKLMECFTKHKELRSQIFFIGNGGSSAIASHMTADFMKNGGMNTYSLYDNAVITCMGNDYGYDSIFSRPLGFLAKEGDLLVAISSSGNSANICKAIEAAKGKGVEIITFTAFRPDNKVKQMWDISVYVPVEKYGMAESIHNLILQQVVDTIMERDGVKL